MTVINRSLSSAPDWAGALSHPIKPSLGGVMLVITGLLLLITSNFVTLDLPAGSSTLLVPACLGMGAFFGLRLGTWVVLGFLITGLLGWPVFANGGGLSYWQQPGFPYLLCLPLATALSGYFIYRWQRPWLASVLAVVVPVILLHTLGMAGLCIQAALGVIDATTIPGWINTLTVHEIVPEMALSAVVVWIIVPMLRLMVNWIV